MITRLRLLTYAVFASVLPALALFAAPANEPATLAVFGVVAAALIAGLASLHTGRMPVVVVAHSGPPPSAQRRRRGSFLRQSNPDTAGRPRPRAPGMTPA